MSWMISASSVPASRGCSSVNKYSLWAEALWLNQWNMIRHWEKPFITSQIVQSPISYCPTKACWMYDLPLKTTHQLIFSSPLSSFVFLYGNIRAGCWPPTELPVSKLAGDRGKKDFIPYKERLAYLLYPCLVATCGAIRQPLWCHSSRGMFLMCHVTERHSISRQKDVTQFSNIKKVQASHLGSL